MDSLSDSTYNGLDLLVLIFSVLLLWAGAVMLSKWHETRYETRYVAPERPRSGPMKLHHPQTGSGPRSPGIGQVYDDEHGDRHVWTGKEWMSVPPGGPRSFWDSKKIRDIPEAPLDDPYVRAFLYGTDIPPLPFDFTVEKTTPITSVPRRNGLSLANGLAWSAVPIVPGLKSAIVAASEAQAQAQHDHMVELLSPSLIVDELEVAERLLSEVPFDHPLRFGFRIIPRPYDWQRDNSGLA